jgi:pectin methylesterase-like acyl-CoA thioesterase
MTTTASTTSVKLDWSSNSESDLAGYLVSRSSTVEGTYTELTASPRTGSDYTDTTAPVGVASFYRVIAVDKSGNQSAPVNVSATRKDGVPPAAPASLVATGTTGGVSLDWADNPEADLAGYLVSRATSSGGTYTKLAASPITGSQYQDSSAPADRVSFYRVTAVDASGNTSAAANASAAPADASAPAAVSGMTVSADTSRVKLDWTSNSEPDLAGYLVYRATSAEGDYTKVTASPVTSSEYSDTAAPAGLPSYYRVTAVDKSGNESASVSATGTRRDKTAPGQPTGLTANSSSDSITLDWADNTEADLVGYVVSRATSSGGTYTRLTATPISASTYVDAAAPTGLASYYRVSAVDLSGNVSTVAGISATRPDVVAPTAPAGLEASVGDAQLTLSWAANSEADLAGYRVYRWVGDDESAARLTSTLLTSPTYVDRTASNGTSYTYAVTAVDQAGNESLQSTAVTATPADVTAPMAPKSLTATGSSTGVDLDWADNTEADLAGYVVYRATADGDYVRLTPTPLTASTYSDDTATAHTVSSYRVTAVDRIGHESPVSETASAKPADTSAPGRPSQLTATGTEAGVTLDWADQTEVDLGGYLVYRADTAEGPFTNLTTGPVTTSTFDDTTASKTATSYYRVTAVDTTGNESAAATADGKAVADYSPVAGADLTVAQDGTGDHTTVAAALAAAPSNATTPFVIAVRPGTYRELLTVAKPNITLTGTTDNASDVVITYNNAAGTTKDATGATYGTTGSASVLITAKNVTTKNLTIENSYRETGTGSEQAVALKTTGDRLVFDNVRLLGDQDTLYADGPSAGAPARSYYVNSYIEGDVDYLFGRGTAVFDRSTLHASSRGSATNNGYVTAASTHTNNKFGFLITDSTITSDAPAGTFALGRPWQPSGDVNAIAQVVIRDTVLPAAIKSSPWVDMASTFSWRNARFFEFNNSGPGAGLNADRPQLSTQDAATYTKFAYLAGSDGWNPTGQTPPPPPADTVAPLAPTGLAAQAGDASVELSWTASPEADTAGYNLYRSSTGPAGTSSAKLNADLLTGTSHTDRTAANDTSYSYVLTAVDKAGNESPASAPATADPAALPLPAHDILVAADGSGDYTTVQAAIAAAPAGTAARPTVIAIKPGTYRELVMVSKNYVTLIGTTGNPRDVVLTYDNAAGTTNPATGATYGTGGSQSVLVSGSNVTVRDLTIENAFDEAAYTYSAEQAVALKTTGDRLRFDNIRVLGNQDTLLVDSPDAPIVSRSYFTNSFIQGDVDFIFGRGTAVFDKSTINALTRGSSSNNGYITAASTSDKNQFGFLITNSTITSNAPAGTFSLGRPWRGWTDGYPKNGVVYNSRGQVTIRDTALPAAVRTTRPWADMTPNLWTDGRFFEYGNTGPGAVITDPSTRPQLSDAAAADHTTQAYLAGTDGWNPTS